MSKQQFFPKGRTFRLIHPYNFAIILLVLLHKNRASLIKICQVTNITVGNNCWHRSNFALQNNFFLYQFTFLLNSDDFIDDSY